MTVEDARNEFQLMFANNLKRELNAKGWSQNELGRRMGVTSAIVSAWCRGEKFPTYENLNKLCGLLGCARVDLMESPTEAARYHQQKRLSAYAALIDETPELAKAVAWLIKVPAEDMPRVIEMIKLFAKEDPNEEA